MHKQQWLYRIITTLILISLLAQTLLSPGRVIAATAPPSPPKITNTAEITTNQPATTAPEQLPAVLSISRVQSGYQAGATTVISFTVTNLLPVVAPPDIPEGATVTETAQLLATVDPTLDPNTIHDVVIVDALTTAQFIEAAPPPATSANTLVWNIGSLAPGASHTVSLTVDVPATAPGFVDLDAGAAAYGALQGRLVQAQAAPARLAPDGFAQWLVSTPDANVYDAAMLRGLATVGHDPADLFVYVRSFDFEAYTGSLRGTRGTLWSEAGNALDQASLLIAMLRASGIPARYRHGTLSTAHAQTLIASMFPEPTATVGHIPEGAPVSDPVNDPALIAEVADHWWVEAYLPGSGWTDLDPAFAAANPGDIFATPAGDSTDRIAEVPATTRHTVHLELEVEKYSDFPIGGLSLSRTTPLTATFNTVELVGLPINLAFVVATDLGMGLTFSSITHTYTPFFRLGDSGAATMGEPIGELLTTFPLATNYVTGLWLAIETETPSGETVRYEREIKDRIGVDVRLNGGNVQLEPVGDEPFISAADVAQVQVVPHSRVPASELDRVTANVMATTAATGAAYLAFSALDEDDTLAVIDWISEHGVMLQDAQVAGLDLLGTAFNVGAGAPENRASDAHFLVTSYPDQAKLLLLSNTTISETATFSFELLNTRERALAYPGQSPGATIAANTMRTLNEKGLEFSLLSRLDAATTSAYETVLTAIENDLPLALITADNMADLDDLLISGEAKGRIAQALYDGDSVFVPVEPVLVDGELRTGWLEIDATGYASYVDEQGRRAVSLVEYGEMMIASFWGTGHGMALIGGVATTLIFFIGNLIGMTPLDMAIGEGLGASVGAAGAAAIALGQAAMEAAGACGKAGTFAGDCLAGVGIAVLLISPLIVGKGAMGDPSLPPMLYNREALPFDASRDSATVAYAATTGATTLDVAANTGNASLSGQVSMDWNDSNAHSLLLTTFTAPSVDLYDDQGAFLSSGALALQPGEPVQAALSGAVSVALSGEGTLGFYAPAVAGMGSGSQWDTYTAGLSSAQPYTLALRDAQVTLDGSPFAGTLTAIVNGTSTVGGVLDGPLPLFSGGTTVQTQGANLMTGPLAGTVTAGGAPFDAANGIAVANVDGPLVLTEIDARTDQVQFGDTVEFFTLDLSQTGSTLNPTQSATFDALVRANVAGTYTVTVDAPRGWAVGVTTGGAVTVTPSPGAAPADYAVLVTAQSASYPGLFVSAWHTVTIVPFDGVALALVPDPLIAVPMGDVARPNATIPGDAAGHIVNGRAEIPESAFTIVVTNTSNSARTFDIDVSGLPAGWAVLSNAGATTQTSLALDAGQAGYVGLYVVPAGSSMPSPGTSHLIQATATAQDNGSLQASDSHLWTMPGVAFPYPTVAPDDLYAGPGEMVSTTLSVQNVGNVSGSFPVTFTMRASVFNLAPLTPSLLASSPTWTTPALAPGEAATTAVAIDTTGTALGDVFTIKSESRAGEFRPAAYARLRIAGPESTPVFAALACQAGEGVESAYQALAIAMLNLELSCAGGECDLAARDAVVDAAYALAGQANVAYPTVDTASLETAAAGLAAQTDGAGIESALAALSAEAVTLATSLCEAAEHQPVARFSPTAAAAMPGGPAAFTLTVTNAGSVTTTYAITTTLPGGPLTSSVTLAPGASADVPYTATASGLGTYLLEASVAATGAGVEADVGATARAALYVVDRFVQLTAVTPDPAFVETAASSTTVSIDVTNVANVEQETIARLRVLAPDGAAAHSADLPLTLLRGDPRTYTLATVDTSGWAEGVYTVSVELLDGSLALIPDGSNYGYLAVGQGLRASHAASPTLVAPGDVTVTTVITTELVAPPVLPEGQPSALSSQLSAVSGQPLPPRPTPSRPHTPTPLRPASATAITRTQDTSPTITYSGTWAVVNNIFATHTSDGSYTWSGTAGDSATFVFTGTWVHVGFAFNSQSGRADVRIDGVSQGIVELYEPDKLCYNPHCVGSVAYGGLADGPHTLEIVVTGTSHPNSEGTQVRLDYIDTWDGTAYPDGTFEEDDARVWRRDTTWARVAEPAASGGFFLNGQTTQSLWFPFTGDSISLVGLDRYDGHTVKVYVDGVWQGDILNYAGTPVSRTTSFSGFGPGPHVMQVSAFRGEPNIDAFITPAVGPDYDPPTYTGFVRYEEDDPALRYNGYDVDLRPTSWSPGNAAQASEYSYMFSTTLSDTVSLEFYGSWLNIGLRTRTRGGLADVTVDGVSLGTINAYSVLGEDAVSYQFDLITGTHTLTITVLDESDPPNLYSDFYLDFIEVWDGTPVTDTFQNALKGQESGRVFVSSSFSDASHENAIQGDYVVSGLPNSNANVWYNFVGDSVTVYGLTVNNGGTAEVYIDGILTDTISFDYPFSVQPLAFHYTGLDDGPHTVRVHNVDSMRLDGFASNQPKIPYQPVAEWWDNTPQGNGAPFFGTVGMAAGMTAADLDSDGSVEIVVTADDMINFGTLFVFRGDGADTGDGDPILWSHDFGGGAFRTWVSSPAIADLDGQPGAEIVVAARDELWAFHSDGSTYWTITGTASIFETLTAPAIANLDLDPEPEIVVNLDDTLEIREHDGTFIWSTVYPNHANPPVLADLTGDGFLDILITGWDDDVILYDFNFGSPQIVWSQVLSTTMNATFGAPAVADIDGQQPGGDPGPEIAIASDGRLTVLNGEDGSVVWSTPLDPGYPGGVAIADLDGDGEVEIVTGMRYEFETGRFGKIYALNADGTLLWDAIAEDSSSANNTSVLDLDGDGVYEVAWNGKEQGFTIYNGADGSIRFNEPLLYSVTGTDYPIFADVDGDSFAEVVVATLGGLRVVGFDGVWGDARPLWNQHSYHITNVNDDLSVPSAEVDSWTAHNTYRTQTPVRSPLPVYDVALTHTVGISGVTVLTGTFNVAPDAQADPVYRWDYTQTSADPVVTRTFATALAAVQPGEARQVAQGTEVAYTLPGGSNRLVLPPLYASAPHIVDVVPAMQATGAGGTVFFDVVLTNPGTALDTYSLTIAGLPEGWAQLVATVDVAADGAVTVPLTVTVPSAAAMQAFDFVIGATNSAGGHDRATASLAVIDALDAGLTPQMQFAPTGSPVSYTLTITNYEAITRTYTLSAAGMASASLPPTITVAPGESLSLPFAAQATVAGPNPFTASVTGDGGSDSATAVVEGTGTWDVAAALSPSTATGGPGASTVMTLTVSNLGDVADSYDLDVGLPAGWTYALKANGMPVSSIDVPAGVFNTVALRLIVTPDAGTAPSLHPISVTVTSQSRVGVQTVATGELDVGDYGVEVQITPGDQTVDPRNPAAWDVTITNRGSVPDSFDLALSGVLGAFGTLADATGTLNPGQSQVVQLTADDLDLLLHGTYAFAVTATSQGDSAVAAEDAADVTLDAFEGVAVHWLPAEQTLTDTLATSFLMVITNTSNVETNFTLTASSASLHVALPPTEILLPAHSVASVPVPVTAPGAGTYTLDGSATSAGAAATHPATLTVIADNIAPVANAGAGQTVAVSATVTLDGSASYDPDGDEPLSYGWQQTGGPPVALSSTTVASPVFVAPSTPSVLTFTLAVTDSLGLADPTPDVVVVDVRNYIYLPLVLKSHE